MGSYNRIFEIYLDSVIKQLFYRELPSDVIHKNEEQIYDSAEALHAKLLQSNLYSASQRYEL